MTTHGPTILVIDDNEGLVNLLRRYLADQPCQVLAATNGSEGLQMARDVLPRAVVLDVMMPDMDGWELLQRIKTNPETEGIPVIVCSVIDDPELAYSLGAERFIAKPVNRQTVLEALHEIKAL
jgi:CheY-like chemotaxis protein